MSEAPISIRQNDAAPLAEAETASAAALSDDLTSGEPLLACLEYITRWSGHPRSQSALIASLPDKGHGFDLDQFRMAAEKAGFAVNSPHVANPARLDAAALPALLITAEGPAVLLGWEGDQAELFRPEVQTTEMLTRAELEAITLTADPVSVHLQTDWQNLASASTRPDAVSAVSRHWFWGPISENRWIYLQVALASLMINLFALATPLFVMNVYDRVLPNNALETGWALGLGALVVFGFDFLLRGLRGYFIDIAGRRADLKLATRLYDQILGIRLDHLHGRSSGALANMLREFESVREFFTSATMASVVDLPFVFLFMFVIFMIGGPIAFGMALAVVVIVTSGLLLQLPLKRLINHGQLAEDSRHGLMVETLQGLETVRSTGADRRLRARYADLLAESTVIGQKSRLWAMQGLHLTVFLQQSASVFVILVGMYLVAEGTLTVGGLIACVILGSRSISPLAQVAQLATRFQTAKHALASLNRLMDEPVERPANHRFLHRDSLRGRITLEGVGYRYPASERPVLRNISLNIEPGEKVGLVGRVGSGKSTAARLIAGLASPQEGLIRIDDTDMAQIDPADLRRNLALVPQDTFLFRGTLRENIAIGRPGTTDAEILAAAELSGVHDFASRHPRGYDMRLGERGHGLSGGQRQAVALARAILSGANTVILDEATNAMDTQGEAALCQRLQPWLKDRTLLLVTHRHNMLSLVDRIIVLDQGMVVADGPRDQIVEALATGKIKAAGA
jgi:ATP-binding cassette, subfamily C, bacterial LapB